MPSLAPILAIESSCDETAVAVLRSPGIILSSLIASQAEEHARFGGVVPEVASRNHLLAVDPLARRALEEADVSPAELGAIVATSGPGLAPALLVGASYAKGFALGLGIPYLALNHLEGHLLSPFLGSEEIPDHLALLVSGGHTQLTRVRCAGDYTVLGRTLDDAAGEAFDKSAKLMGVPYPGGPGLAKLAEQGDPAAYKLPRPLLHSGNFDFSFAGLKTAVLTQAQKLGAAVMQEGSPIRADLAASTQAAIVEVLVKKSMAALKHTGQRCLVVAGGVGANRELRRQLNAACALAGVRVHYPELHLCTDNGAMIAMAAAMRLDAGRQVAENRYSFDVKPRWPLDALV